MNDKNNDILSFNSLLELIEIGKLGQILSENKNGNLDIITIEKIKQIIIGDCKCWICKINGNNNKLGLYHFVDTGDIINENDEIDKNDEIDIVMDTEEKDERKEKDKNSKEKLDIDTSADEGFVYTPNIDKFDESNYYDYIKKDKYGHVVNTYKIKHNANGESYLKVGVPRANGTDYTMRTYFVTEVENFDALKDYEWKVYKDGNRYKIAYQYKDNKTGRTITLKAIEVIAKNQKLDLDFIIKKQLDNSWGFGPNHDKEITTKRGKTKIKVNGKRLCAYPKNGNTFMCFKFNLKVEKYVNIVSSRFRRSNNNNDVNNSKKQKTIEEMLKEIETIIK